MPSLLDIDSFMKNQSAQPSRLGTQSNYSTDDIHNLITNISLAEGVDPELVRSIVKVESGFDPNAKSPTSSASGLMQLIKGTANEMGVKNVFDPVDNLTGGIRYLKKHLDATGGNVDKALGMYNQGPAGDLSKAQDYVNTVKKFYKGGNSIEVSKNESTINPDLIGELVTNYGTDPYAGKVKSVTSLLDIPNIPQEQPDAIDVAQGIDNSALGRGVRQALQTSQPQMGKLPFGIENKGSQIEQAVKDVLYGVPEGLGTLAAGIPSFIGGQVAGSAELSKPKSLTENLAGAFDVAEQVSSTGMGHPQTATGQLLLKPIEVVFGTILNTVGEVVKDLNPDATPQELETKTKAAQYVTNSLLLGLPMAAKKFNSTVKVTPEMASPEAIQVAKENVKSDPNVSSEIKAQVDSVDINPVDAINQKIQTAQAKARVEKSGGMVAKFPENQSIVDGLLTEVELREGRAKTTMRKAAQIVADMDGDVAGVDLVGVKGINPEGSTGKAIARLVAEREALKKTEERIAQGTGDDVPMEQTPVVETLPEVPTSEPAPEPVVDPMQSMAQSVEPNLRYIGKTDGIPEAGIQGNTNFSLMLDSGQETGLSINGEVTPEKIAAEVQKTKEKFQVKEEVPTIESKVEETKNGQVQKEKEEVVIPEFDTTSKAKEEGYIFPDKNRYSSLERAQAKATELGEGHEVLKVKGKYKVAKFEETPVMEFADEASAKAAGWELMSEVPADRVQFESPSEGFGLAKVGDKYYRISKYVEMPEREVKSDLIPKDKWEDDVSPEDWAALKSLTDESTYNEIVAQDKLKELAEISRVEEVKTSDFVDVVFSGVVHPDMKSTYATNLPKMAASFAENMQAIGGPNPGKSGEGIVRVYKSSDIKSYGTNNEYILKEGAIPIDTLTPEEARLYVKNSDSEFNYTKTKVNSNAALAQAFLEWRDSYVTKCNTAIKSKKGKTSVTKESLSIVDDNFKTFDSEEAIKAWIESNGKVGEIISDPLTGKYSILDTEKFGRLDEMDMWEEGIEQLTSRRDDYSDGMLSSDDLYNVGKSYPSIINYPFKIIDGDRIGRNFYKEVYPSYRLGGEKTTGVKTIGEAFQTILKYTTDSVESRIVNKLYQGLDKDIPLIFEDQSIHGSKLRSIKTNSPIMGKYAQWETGYPRGYIALATEDHTSLTYSPNAGEFARTIIHEGAHSILSRGLRKGLDERKTSTYSAESVFAASIDRAFQKAKEQLSEKYPKEYGLTNIQEFLAEALSNNKFQDLLKEVKMYNGTVWGKLVESIREFLGFSKEESNAFFKVLDATDKYIDTISPDFELSDTGKMDLWSILSNERGSVDVTGLYSAVDKIQSIVKIAEKMGKSIDEYLASIGADEAAISAFNAMLTQVPQMRQQIKDQDSVTSSILMPEGKIVAQKVNKNKAGQIKSVGPPITETLASKVMNAPRDLQWGTDIVRKDPETGRIKVEHTSNAYEKAMQATEVKINSFRAAGIPELYHQWREAKKMAQDEKIKVNEWLDSLEKQIDPERREAFAIAAYADMKSVKEAFNSMGITEIPTLTPKESIVLEQLLDYTRKFRDRSNYIRTHTGQKAIPKLKDMKGRENYLPLMRDLNVLRDLGITEGLVISDSGKLGELSKNFNGMFNPHSKKRNVSAIPIELDPFKALRRHAEYGLDEIHISPVAALAKDLANVKLPRVDQAKGKISLAEWNPYLSNMLSRWSDQIVGKDIVGTAMANANPFFSWAKDRLSKNLVVGTIGGSLRTVLVQPTSYIIGVPTMLDMRSTGYGIVKLMSERPFGKSNARKHSSILAIREADYAFNELAEYIKQGKMKGSLAYVAEKSLAPMKWLDSIMAEASWNAARYYGEKRLKLQGKDLYRFADDVVERTQGLGIKGAVSDIQSSAATKWLTLLQTFAIADFNLIARDVLGIKNPELNQSKTIGRVVKYIVATALAGQMYKMIGMENVVPDPIGAYQQAKKDGKGDLKAIGSAAGELLEKIPIIGGSAKFGSSLFGIAGEWADIIPEAGEKFSASLDWGKLTDKQKSYNIRLIARAVGLTMGIPMTNQILKSINSAYKGGNPWQVILGVYDKEKKRGGSLRPEIPRPPIPRFN